MTVPSALPVRIRWTCPCGHRNRWEWERDGFEEIPCQVLDCEKCGRACPCEVAKIVYRVIP